VVRGVVPVFGVGDVGVFLTDLRVNGGGNEDPVEARVLLLIGPKMGPEVAAGVFGKDVSDIVLGSILPHKGGEGRSFAGVVHVAVNDDAGVGILGEDGITM